MTAGGLYAMVPTSASIWALRKMEKCRTSDYVDWAIGMLEQGADSRHLRILAGLVPADSLFEAEDYFKRAARELKLDEPPREIALQAYAVDLAAQIVERQMLARLGVKKLYEVCVHCDYPHEMMVWFNLDDACDDIEYGHEPWLYPGLTKENMESTIIAAAKVYLENHRRP